MTSAEPDPCSFRHSATKPAAGPSPNPHLRSERSRCTLRTEPVGPMRRCVGRPGRSGCLRSRPSSYYVLAREETVNRVWESPTRYNSLNALVPTQTASETLWGLCSWYRPVHSFASSATVSETPLNSRTRCRSLALGPPGSATPLGR